MSLHDRIFGQFPERLKDGSEKLDICTYYDGFADASKQAAELSIEADQLMEEMAAALNEAMEWNWMDEVDPVPDRVEYQVTDVLNKYKAMKERAK